MSGKCPVCPGVTMTLLSEQAERETFRLSRRLSVEITVGVGGIVCEWDPDMPEELTAKELRRYRAARHEMLQQLAKATGGAVICMEV